MIEAITSGVSDLITMTGSVVTAIVTEGGAFAPLLPLIGLAIGATVVTFGIKIVRSLAWGY